ncbi:MAG TPA: LacI family DNA-binding transcriptional regulator [Lachnospiraceae bacterium]|nr:LacI family DNA-binding transcriptional regulator [Lachnospiraceae bacterium]HPF29314.1 LacI family DNA-binding transcriptional regulator [Lachnospiraceae bacterium]
MNISQIAKMAGVSPAAVSRYLNHGYLSEEKKVSIEKVIKETGYIPSSQAQTLRTKTTKLIGVIIPKIDSDSISQVVAGIGEVLTKQGYQMLLANTENQNDRELEFLATFQQHMVDGIILLGTILTAKHKAVLKALNIPFIVLGQACDYASCIYHDDYLAALTLTEYMIEKGHRRIGYLGVTEKDYAVGQLRKQGFLDAMSRQNLEIPASSMRIGSFYMENGYENTKRLLADCSDLDAIVCATDTIALGAIKYLNQLSIKIPNDIAIAGFGDSRISSILSPSLTTIHFYYRECGSEGAKVLIDKIANPSSPNKSLKYGFELIKNETA